MSDQAIWMFVIIILMTVFVYEIARRAKEKIFIKAYKRTVDLTEEEKKLKSGLKLIGEYKSGYYNEERRCWEFKFKSVLSNIFTVFSNVPMEEFLSIHLIEKNYVIFYSIRAQFYAKKVKPYEKKIGWSVQAITYKGICFLFNLTPTGISASLIIVGAIFTLSFPEVPFAILIGLGVGFIISAINFTISKNEKIRESLLKRKKKTVDTEIFLVPLESEEETIDIYKVKGTRQIIITKPDGVEEYEVVNLSDESEYLIVNGYNELYDLKNDSMVTITDIMPTGETISRKRTKEEMRDLHRSYLARNRFMFEKIFEQNQELERIQREYRKLQGDLQKEKETKDREIRDSMNKIIKEREKQKNTLIDIYTSIHGSQYMGETFEKMHERVMKKIESENLAVRIDKINLIYKTQMEVIKKMSEKTNIDFSEINKLLEIKPIENE